MNTWQATSPWLKRIVMIAALVGTAGGLTIQSAAADPRDNRWDRSDRWDRRHHRHYYQPRDVRPVYAPPVYYVTPPRVPYYAPPPVYAPAPGLSITIPFR